MYAVIFKAKINQLDDEYFQTASILRERAMKEFGCTAFTASCENDLEIAISYWPDLESIKKWKEDRDHKKAKSIGLEKWYESCEIEVVEILRSYSS